MNVGSSRLDIHRSDTAVSATNIRTQPKPAGSAEVKDAVHTLNQNEFFGGNNVLTFHVDQGTRKAVTRLVDRESGEIVRQIPAQYILQLARDLGEKKSQP